MTDIENENIIDGDLSGEQKEGIQWAMEQGQVQGHEEATRVQLGLNLQVLSSQGGGAGQASHCVSK